MRASRRNRHALRPEHLAALAAAALCFATLPLSMAAPAAAVSALLVVRWLPRLGSRGGLAAESQLLRVMPVVLDVLALGLDAGISWDRAARIAADCAPEPIHGDLMTAAGRLALGAAPDEVWLGPPSLGLIGVVVERSFRTGGAVSSLLQQQADALRATERMRRITAVRRLETTILLPITMLAVPAFFVGGAIPMVVSMYGQLMPSLFSTGA